ncbi:MAG: ferredoxin--NADP reductase [Bacteroidetes bacterium QS_9_68_14]|nr:MAG: ferredoxin--NADP reductase [Bacteroidetes bacterium QS_9_68_14]
MDPEKYCRVHLAERIDFTDDLAVFRFRPDEALPFTPGQYATLGLDVEGRERPLLRPYSVASAPHEDVLDFFVERLEDGSLTPRLWDLEPGDTGWVRRRIVGLFTLDRESGRPRHLMGATVTGVAPFVSIARAHQHALSNGDHSGEPPRMLVVHGASHPRELGFYHEELATLEREGWLRYVPTISRPWEHPDWDGETGRVGDVLRKHADAEDFTARNAVAYACGHPGMIENAHAILERAGFDEEHLHEEKYFRA